MKNKQIQLPGITDLYVTWALGLLSGICLFISVFVFVSIALSGLSTLSEPVWPLLFVILIILTFLVAFFVAPALLGSFLSDYKKGLSVGLLGLVIGPFGLWVGKLSWGLILEYLIPYIGLSQNYLSHFYSTLVVNFSSSILIFIIILISFQDQLSKIMSFGDGFIIGFIISLSVENLFGKTILSGDSFLHILWIVPPIVWVTVVYFVERAQGLKSWQGLATWIGLVTFSFLLPLLVYQTPLWLFK